MAASSTEATRTAVDAPATARLNVLDELYLHLDRRDQPWGVHLEARVEGSIDARRLATAVRSAAARHPLARARLGAARATDVRYHWEIADRLDEVDLEVVDGARLTRARETLLARAPALDRPGPFSLLLAHDPEGDVVVLNLHHAAGDGISALRLLRSVALAYGGRRDAVPALDPLAVRDVGALVRPPSLGARLPRARDALAYLGRGVTPPARIARRGGSARRGYGFAFATVGPAGLRRLAERRRAGATVNDVLLAALAVAVRRWNIRNDESCGAVYLMVPVNLRPPAWRDEIVGNFAAYVSVRVATGEQASLHEAVRSVTASTRRIKERGTAGLVVDLFAPPTLLPIGVKQGLQELIPLTADVVVDTAALSNLGRVRALPRFGEAGAVRELRFSPPGRMPLGVSLGAATLGGRLFVTLRYAHAQFDARAAREFLALYEQCLRAA